MRRSEYGEVVVETVRVGLLVHLLEIAKPDNIKTCVRHRFIP